MITLVKVEKVREVPVGVVNAVSWFPNNVQTFHGIRVPSFQLSPYHLRTEEGFLMENVWQGSKVFQRVSAQHQVYANRVTWSHPAEVHVLPGGELTPAYWAWRMKLYQNPHPVRYPNGYNGRRSALYSLWPAPMAPAADGVTMQPLWQQLSYTEARKVIYCPLYSGLVERTEAFQNLLQVFRATGALAIADVDVPNGTVVTPETYQSYLENPEISFGHAWTLAKLLLEKR